MNKGKSNVTSYHRPGRRSGITIKSGGERVNPVLLADRIALWLEAGHVGCHEVLQKRQRFLALDLDNGAIGQVCNKNCHGLLFSVLLE